MSNAVMQGLADNPGIVLRHRNRKKSAVGHILHRDVPDRLKQLLGSQQQGQTEVPTADNPVLFVTQIPTDLCVRRSQEMRRLITTKQEEGRTGQTSLFGDVSLIEESADIPLQGFIPDSFVAISIRLGLDAVFKKLLPGKFHRLRIKIVKCGLCDNFSRPVTRASQHLPKTRFLIRMFR